MLAAYPALSYSWAGTAALPFPAVAVSAHRVACVNTTHRSIIHLVVYSSVPDIFEVGNMKIED